MTSVISFTTTSYTVLGQHSVLLNTWHSPSTQSTEHAPLHISAATSTMQRGLLEFSFCFSQIWVCTE